MLELISRIGAEFGISIVVASHLLGEIERICDHLVAIDGGRLLRADTITSMTQVSQVLLVEVDEGAEQLLAELGRRGLEPRPVPAGGARPARRATPPTTRSATRSPISACRSTGWSSAAATSRNCSGTTASRAGATRRRRHLMSAETGVIHDIGYRRYTGRRLGRAADHPRPVLAQPALRVRDRARRQGQDRAGDHLRGHLPARRGERGRRGPGAAPASSPTTRTCSSCASSS